MKNLKNAMKTVLPGDPQKGTARQEPDVQTILPIKKKPQQVRDFEERSR